jgi:hypothetical protein
MAYDPTSRLDVSGWSLRGLEPAGLSEHPWLARPDDDRLWLYKPVEIKDGVQQGEDWAEGVVTRIGALLGVPCAAVDLAQRHGRDGTVSRDVRPSGWELQPGAVLLGGRIDGYQSRLRLRLGHALINIESVLAGVGPPPEHVGSASFSAYDVFCGYLLMDALVANRDRHDQNWAVVIPPELRTPWAFLAPSYDHGSSLGFGLRDAKRANILSEGTLRHWANKGTAWRFEHLPPPAPVQTLVELAVRGLSTASDDARHYWTTSLERLNEGQIQGALTDTAGLSEIASTFALELLSTNRQRLLERLT